MKAAAGMGKDESAAAVFSSCLGFRRRDYGGVIITTIKKNVIIYYYNLPYLQNKKIKETNGFKRNFVAIMELNSLYILLQYV